MARLKSCKYCNRIHAADYDCGKRPVRYKDPTRIDKFRSTSAWRRKREYIKARDKQLCQICIRDLYDTYYKYNGTDLSVHHIVPISDDWDAKMYDPNLLTLCERHHEMAEHGEIPRAELLAIAMVQQDSFID